MRKTYTFVYIIYMKRRRFLCHTRLPIPCRCTRNKTGCLLLFLPGPTAICYHNNGTLCREYNEEDVRVGYLSELVCPTAQRGLYAAGAATDRAGDRGF